MPADAAHLPTRGAAEVVERFLGGTLEPTAWDHDAHLRVAHHVVGRATTPTAALERLRGLIEAHNQRVGVAPERGGYHETITRYFVEAVIDADAPSAEALLADPRCQRDAPARHWSAAVLASERARTAWVAPDLAPLPWAPPPGR